MYLLIKTHEENAHSMNIFIHKLMKKLHATWTLYFVVKIHEDNYDIPILS